MNDESRIRADEALTLLTNRILLDFISLQVDSGKMTVEEAKALIRFSATEVVRGGSEVAEEVNFFADVFIRRFDDTQYGSPCEPAN